MPRPVDHRSENIMERSGSHWPGNASFAWPASGILPLQLNSKLPGLFFAHAVTSLVWGIQSAQLSCKKLYSQLLLETMEY